MEAEFTVSACECTKWRSETPQSSASISLAAKQVRVGILAGPRWAVRKLMLRARCACPHGNLQAWGPRHLLQAAALPRKRTVMPLSF